MDKRLDQELQQHEKPAFEELWTNSAPLLRRYCLKWVREHADEALSRTAYIAFLRYSQCSDNSVSWLKRVTRNVCNDIHRDRIRAKAEPLDDVAVLAAASGRLIAPDDPEARILQRERAAMVVHALSQLAPPLRKALLLHAVHGLTYPEIASQLAISEATLRKRISIARKQLRDASAGANLPYRTRLRPDIAWSFMGQVQSMSMLREAQDTLPDPAFSAPVLTRLGGVERDGAITIGKGASDTSPATVKRLERHVALYPTGWKRRLTLARIHRTLGDAAAAAAHYEAVLARKPELVMARAEIAEIYLAMGRNEEAVSMYRQIAGRAAGRDGLIAEALASSASGQTDEAVAHLDSRLSTSAEDAGAWLLRGEILLERGRVTEAIGSFERAVALREHDSLALTRLGEALLAAGLRADALAALERAYAADRGNTLALTPLARMHIDDGSPHAAGLVRELVRLAPDHAATAAAAAHELLVAGDDAGARARLHAYVHRHPRHARAWLALAELLHRIGEDAREPPLTPALSPEGRGDWDSGMALARALEIDPTDHGLRSAAIALFIRLRDERWHLLALESAALTDDWRVTTSVLRALLDTRQDLDAAPLLGAIASALQPQLAQSWTLYGRALATCGDARGAGAAFAHAQALQRNENSQRPGSCVYPTTRA